jgi:N-acetylglutamate synthase
MSLLDLSCVAAAASNAILIA